MKIKSIVMTLLFAFTLMAQATTAFAASTVNAIGMDQTKAASCCPECPDCNAGGSCCHHKA
jgi:hypothetical protein